MGSHYDYPPINTSPITPWCIPRAPFTSNVPPEDCYSFLTPPTFTFGPPHGEMQWPPEDRYSYLNPPRFTFGPPHGEMRSPPEDCYFYLNPPRYTSGPPHGEMRSPHLPSFSSSDPQPDFTLLTKGIGLHELHDNSSSGAAKADDYYNALAHTQPDFTRLTEGTGLHELHDNSSSRAAKADDDTGDEHLGGSWVNISDAGIINKPTDDGGLNKPFDGGNKPTDTLAAWNTSWEKETGAGVGAGGYHTCEELSGSGYRARGSCGNACYTCGDADHFARKCRLGADC